MAKCADLGATLFVASPFTDGESSSQEIASRGGYKQVNHALAKALLTFLCEEALFYGCRLHIYGVSSNQEIDLLQPFRSKGNVTISIPLYLLADDHDPFGYTYAAKLSPSPIGQAEKLQLLKAIQNGLCDALTTHHHLYAELLELDPLSAEQGAPLDLQLPSLFSHVETLLGSTLWQNLTETAPRAILSSK
jgi:dihydroorotase-like cyclic amidohydrolase